MTDGTAQARRVAVVTGGAKGIGAEICTRMAAAGHALRIADVDMEEAGRLAAALRASGAEAAPLALDVARPDSVREAFARVDAALGRCDILVNCAGVAKVFPSSSSRWRTSSRRWR